MWRTPIHDDSSVSRLDTLFSRKIVMSYLIAGVAWILITDSLLYVFSDNSNSLAVVEIFKGLFYVLITTGLLYGILRYHLATLHTSRQTLFEVEQQYTTVVRDASDGILIADAHGQVLDINPHISILLGYSRTEALSMNIADVLPADDLRDNPLHFDSLLAGHKLTEERRVRKKDGTLLSVEISATAMSNGRILALVRDITERKRAEEALRQQELYYRSLIEHAQDIISVINPDGSLRFISPSVERVLGYTPEEFTTVGPDSIHPDDLATVLPQLQTLLGHSGERMRFEIRLRHKNGSWKTLEGIAKNMIDNPVIHGVVINTRDITRRKQAEEYLQLFRLATEQTDDAVLLVDTSAAVDYHTLYSNSAFSALTGHPPDATAGKQPAELLNDSSDSIAVSIGDCVRLQRPFSGETTLYRTDGTSVPVEWSATPLYNSKQEYAYAVCVLRNITERKRNEAVLIAAKEEAEDMNRLKTALIGNMNHEFRTPMNGILGFSDILMHELPDEEHRSFAQMIHTSATRLMTTLNNVLLLAQVASDSIAVAIGPVDLKDDIEMVLGHYRPLARDRGVRLFYDTVAEPITAAADPALLHEVMSNLLSNAFKFTHKGSVTVQVFTDHYNGTPHAAIRIIDTGIGISPEFMQHLFEEFSQESAGTARMYEGCGLGLTVVKRFLDLLHGAITVDSEIGRGSIFTVYLPLYKAEHETSAPDNLSIPGGLHALLILDSYSDTPSLMERYLDGVVHLTVARDTASAIAAATNHHYDLVLLDVVHNGTIDIQALLGELRSIDSYGTLPVIALTDYTGTDSTAALGEAGCSEFLAKPFTRMELLTTVARCVPAG